MFPALALLLLLLASPSCSSPDEKRLVNWLMEGYNREERPVLNESDPVHLSVKLELRQILDLDEKNQVEWRYTCYTVVTYCGADHLTFRRCLRP